MIVKVMTVDNGWEYFNCPKGVKARTLRKEQWKFLWNSSKDENYIILQIPETGSKSAETVGILDTPMRLINIYDVVKIYTNKCVYLLNDQGKTIEKLN